ncbi:MAG TPA: polyprenyl synthetase family protein [Sandaracinaceae bacterium LLY-WYZ-13_1]|nr:polyprenyl synthetase family protein [Sandaracinaceae bacterium LLY-WYZ-13_1]
MDGWLAEVKDGVEARLREILAEDRARLVAIAPEAAELMEGVESLTLRGGKRLRPAVLYAAYRAVRPEAGVGDVVDAGAALELLQSYLLIHDDWMDGDEERRGGPSVHALLRDRHGDARLGASLAILAGNLACTLSWRRFERATGEPGRREAALAVVTRMHEEVLVGQQLDLRAVEDVSRMQQLKTGSYTLRGPIALGAALAGATDAQSAALDRFAHPLGEAFQMRDDLLGTFGDPASTGKPAGNDLRAGKRTALVAAAEARCDEARLAPLRTVLGNPEASDAAVGDAIALLEASGARDAVETRLSALLDEARAALADAPLHEPGVTMLNEVADRLAYRRS